MQIHMTDALVALPREGKEFIPIFSHGSLILKLASPAAAASPTSGWIETCIFFIISEV